MAELKKTPFGKQVLKKWRSVPIYYQHVICNGTSVEMLDLRSHFMQTLLVELDIIPSPMDGGEVRATNGVNGSAEVLVAVAEM